MNQTYSVVVPVRPHDIAMHVASIYDVENEHDYIMDKALQAYTQHRRSEEDAGHFRIGRGEGGGKGGVGGGGRPQTAKASLSSRQDHQNTNNSTHCHHHHQRHRRRLLSSSSDGNLSSCSSSFSSSRNALLSERKKAGFKLSLCTLKDGTGNEPIPVPHTHSTPGPGFLPLQRPWSALPSGRLDAIREVSLANNVAER
ncbi:hypothetical protein V1264_001969 [Littorina saxatilis]|uniref:Uncharacterized protein n=1 Tax=Littorina saxatilis TaxID=31220 RepID=A0AAN9GPP9_9CAEN